MVLGTSQCMLSLLAPEFPRLRRLRYTFASYSERPVYSTNFGHIHTTFSILSPSVLAGSGFLVTLSLSRSFAFGRPPGNFLKSLFLTDVTWGVLFLVTSFLTRVFHLDFKQFTRISRCNCVFSIFVNLISDF